MKGSLTSGRGVLLCLAAMAGVAGACLAQEGEYRLGVEDVIGVQVLYQPQFSVESAVVRPDGRISVPVAGDVQAAGRTVLEVAAAIAEALRAELREPQVTVRLIARHVEPIYVLGAVRQPGAIAVREPVTVAEAITLAGGLSPGVAARHGLLIGGDGEQTHVDLAAALAGRAPDGALTVRPGQTLLVSAQFLVSVVGRVAAPGRYPLEEGDRVADLLAAAGGLSEAAADTGELVRADGTALTVDLRALTESGDAAANLALSPDDLLVVPEVRRRVTLAGAFTAPGRYDFDAGERLTHAMALARGPAEGARLGAAVLVRTDGSSRRLDLEALLQGEPGDDPELADGDLVILPRETDQVAVLGMVEQPGVFALEPEMTLMDGLALAGGWAQRDARPARTILWRRGVAGPEMTFVDAQALMAGRPGIENPRLQAGDIVFVPSSSTMSRQEASQLLLGIAGLLRLVF